MTAHLSNDDLHALIAALLNRVGQAGHEDVRPEVVFLLGQFECMPRNNEVEQTAILVAHNHLSFGRVDAAAIKVCDALSRRLFRTF
jgi:hypothetical protein